MSTHHLESSKHLRRILKAANQRGKKSGSTGDIEWLITEKKNRANIYLAPSDSFRDIAISLNLHKWHYPDRGYVHNGYYIEAHRLFNAQSVFEKLDGKQVSIWGHSLGAAVGALLGLILHDRKAAVVERIETFGSPAFLSSGFNWPSDLPLHQYRCGIDPITHWAPGYHHLAPPTFLESPYAALNPFRLYLDHKLRTYIKSWNFADQT